MLLRRQRNRDFSAQLRLGATLLFAFLLASHAAYATCIEAPIYVEGSSLAPFVENGATLMGHLGADCPDPMRGDLVLFTHPGSKLPLFKIVIGVPGDSFDLKADGARWDLLINGAAAKNAEGIPYRLPHSRDYMLRLYLKGTHGTIPADTWLVMGDNPAGTNDSTRFGLIPRADIIGGATRPSTAATPLARTRPFDFNRLFASIIKAIQELKTELDRDHDAVAHLKADNDTLKADVAAVKIDNENLKAIITVVKADNDSLSAEQQKLEARLDAPGAAKCSGGGLRSRHSSSHSPNN